MTGRYAAGTDVPVDRSKAELERLLVRYEATAFLYGWEDGQYQIGFRMRERMIRFRLPMPSEDDETFWTTDTGRDRTAKAATDRIRAGGPATLARSGVGHQGQAGSDRERDLRFRERIPEPDHAAGWIGPSVSSRNRKSLRSTGPATCHRCYRSSTHRHIGIGVPSI